MLPISVIIPTRNEAKQIASTIEAALKYSDDVHVVDSNSNDNTKAIAFAAGANVIDFKWNGTYPKKKQWCLDNVSTKYSFILFLDADEYLSESGVHDIRVLLRNETMNIAAIDLQLRYFFIGKELKFGYKVWKRAVLHRDRVEFPVIHDAYQESMGEQEGHYQPIVRSGELLKIRNAIIHNDDDPFETWLSRHVRYAKWEASLIKRNVKVAKYKTNQGRLFAAIPFKPLVFFVYTYFIRLGFLDGKYGFWYAYHLSWYYSLIRFFTFLTRNNKL